MKISRAQESEVLKALREGDAARLRGCVERLPEGYDASIFLELAARRGDLECVEALIPVSDFDYDACGALESALVEGHDPCALRLIEVSRLRGGGRGALTRAVELNRAQCVKALIKRVDPKANGSAALRLAASEGAWESVAELDAVCDFRAVQCEALVTAGALGRLDWVGIWGDRLSPAERARAARAMRARGGEAGASLMEARALARWESSELAERVQGGGSGEEARREARVLGPRL